MALNRVVAGGALCAAVAVGAMGGAVIGVPGLSAASQFPASATSASNTAQTGGGVTTQAGPHGFLKDGLLDAAAKALNLTPQQLQDKLKDGKTTIADVAKEQNVPLDKVVQAMADADKDRIEKIVNEPWPTAPGPGAPGFKGGPGFGIGRGPNGALAGPAGVGFDAIAKALGITPEQLKQDLKDGKSITDIAKDKNIDVNKLIQDLVDQADARIDQAVKDKHLTQEQGDALKKGLKDMVSAFVNGDLPKFGGKGGIFGGHFGFGGPDKPGVNPSTPPTTTP